MAFSISHYWKVCIFVSAACVLMTGGTAVNLIHQLLKYRSWSGSIAWRCVLANSLQRLVFLREALSF